MNSLAAYLVAQARKQPLAAAQFTLGELWRRARLRWTNSLEKGRPKLSVPGPAERFAPFLPARALDTDLFCKFFPGARGRTLAAADRICRHEFSIFGQPVSFGPAVDWHTDPAVGYRWPLNPPGRLRHSFAPPGADVKRLWELARFHHLLPLGIASAMAPDARYACDFPQQVLDFIEKNPYPLGIHWAMPMEAAVRAVNWTTAAAFFAARGDLNHEFWRTFLASLFLHGRHIYAHREWNPVARGNHYVSCVVGLLYLGILFRDTPEGQRWLAFARRELPREIEGQVGADGVAHEGSTGYHAFVTELALSAALLAVRADFSSSPVTRAALLAVWGQSFVSHLEKMVSFLAVLRAGRAAPPRWGDSDDGRLLPFCSDERCVADASAHLFSLGTALFSGNSSADHHACEELWWQLGSTPQEPSDCHSGYAESAHQPPAAYPSAGFYFFSSSRIAGGMRCGPLGLRGWSNHAHCDQLSLEFCYDGQPVIVDPGTFAYTGDLAARDLFRSTRYHNTVVLDGAEQNRFWQELPFRIVDDTQSRMLHFAAGPDRVEFEGQHFGYRRLPQRATVRRRLVLHRIRNALLLVDQIEGAGVVRIQWPFHLAPGLAPQQISPDRALTGSRLTRPPWLLDLDHALGELALLDCWQIGPMALLVFASGANDLRAAESSGWVAPHYARREPASILEFSARSTLPARAAFLFLPFDDSVLAELGAT